MATQDSKSTKDNRQEKKKGGTQWELATAGEQMIAARHANDPEAEVLALIRFADGLRNSSLGVVGQVLAPLADQIRALGEQIERSDSSRLDNRSELRLHLDEQFDHTWSEVDELKKGQAVARDEVRDGLARLGKTETDIDELRAITEAHTADIAAMRQADRDDIRAKIAHIEAHQERLDREHQELRERLERRGGEAENGHRNE